MSQDDVLKVLKTNKWLSAIEIQKELKGKIRISVIYGNLKRLLKYGEIEKKEFKVVYNLINQRGSYQTEKKILKYKLKGGN